MALKFKHAIAVAHLNLYETWLEGNIWKVFKFLKDTMILYVKNVFCLVTFEFFLLKTVFFLLKITRKTKASWTLEILTKFSKSVNLIWQTKSEF